MGGRGQLSQEALAYLTQFFLQTCLDQVSLMASLVWPERLRDCILHWAAQQIRDGVLPQNADRVLEAVLYRGSLPRGDVPGLLDASERQARRVVDALTERNVLTAISTRSPLRLAFLATLAVQWMPGLFPEARE